MSVVAYGEKNHTYLPQGPEPRNIIAIGHSDTSKRREYWFRSRLPLGMHLALCAWGFLGRNGDRMGNPRKLTPMTLLWLYYDSLPQQFFRPILSLSSLIRLSLNLSIINKVFKMTSVVIHFDSSQFPNFGDFTTHISNYIKKGGDNTLLVYVQIPEDWSTRAWLIVDEEFERRYIR